MNCSVNTSLSRHTRAVVQYSSEKFYLRYTASTYIIKSARSASQVQWRTGGQPEVQDSTNPASVMSSKHRANWASPAVRQKAGNLILKSSSLNVDGSGLRSRFRFHVRGSSIVGLFINILGSPPAFRTSVILSDWTSLVPGIHACAAHPNT